jgi:hypothetical protein
MTCTEAAQTVTIQGTSDAPDPRSHTARRASFHRTRNNGGVLS